MSPAARTGTLTKVTTPHRPTQSVARAMSRYGLDSAQLGPESAAAWFTLLGPIVRAARHKGDEAHEWADAFLLRAPELLGALAARGDPAGAAIVSALQIRWKRMRKSREYDLTVDQVLLWLSEDQSASGVADCIRLVPPADVEIVRRVGTRSYQKRVFHAVWDASGRRQRIVLKEFLDEEAAAAIPHEMQAYPLSMLHPNIIQTYRLENPVEPDRPFLAERRIHPLGEQWDPAGIGEAALVLTDIARALAFLAEQNLVHGDIKPDNLGYDKGSYLLLDFGVARTQEAFEELPGPTGTLSTRAPEVIRGQARQTPKSDVYALAACVFFFLYRRYPLVAPEDKKGDPKTPRREAYVRELKTRLEQGWEGDLDLLENCEHRALRQLLREMLNPNPKLRLSADVVLRRALKELPALIGTPVGLLFRASDELKQLDRYLSRHAEDMRLMPQRKAWDLEDRLGVLDQGLGLTDLSETITAVSGKTDELLLGELPQPLRELLERARIALRKVPAPYETLVDALRERLGHRNDDWPARSHHRWEPLNLLIESEEMAALDVSYVEELEALIGALERAESLATP
jgi:serine/threonine protein kinase